MYDESMYRLLPHGLAPAGVSGGGGLGPHAPPHATSIDSCLLAAATGACYGMTDEELQREYAVVLDALNGGPSAAAAAGNPCCNAACHQIAAESPREQTLGCGKFQQYFFGVHFLVTTSVFFSIFRAWLCGQLLNNPESDQCAICEKSVAYVFIQFVCRQLLDFNILLVFQPNITFGYLSKLDRDLYSYMPNFLTHTIR